ncbi:MAG: DinB family protein [Chloroflexi bacterium]|nr:DinB family protein [Chloroflexota bacterium]
MNVIQFILMTMEDLHRGFRSEVELLTPDQIYYRPTAEANSIALVLWHAAMTEDGLAQRVAHSEGSIWEREEWHQRLGVGPKDSLGSFTTEQLGTFRPAKEELLLYCQKVWDTTPGLLGSLTEADLDHVPNPERARMTVGRTIANILIGHCFWHLGDIRFLKGLQGMPFGR